MPLLTNGRSHPGARCRLARPRGPHPRRHSKNRLGSRRPELASTIGRALALPSAFLCGPAARSNHPKLSTEARAKHVDCHVALLVVTRAKLWIVAVASLLAMALLSLAVSRGDSALMLDRNAIHLLGRPPDVALWKGVADYFAAPVIAVVLIASLIVGAFHRILLRVGVFAGFAAAAFVVSELIVKPAVGERFFGQLSFPSGNVTAVCATSVAMWIALLPGAGEMGTQHHVRVRRRLDRPDVSGRGGRHLAHPARLRRGGPPVPRCRHSRGSHLPAEVRSDSGDPS